MSDSLRELDFIEPRQDLAYDVVVHAYSVQSARPGAVIAELLQEGDDMVTVTLEQLKRIVDRLSSLSGDR